MQWRAEEGLWNGGQVIGYDIDPDNKGILMVNPTEARIVKEIFDTYIKFRSFRRVAQAINEKGYRSKSYQSRRGHTHGNKKFTKSAVIHILTNPVYIGKITHLDHVYSGKHQEIIDEITWKTVSECITANKVVRAKPRKQEKHCFLLEGLVRCGHCGAYMTPSYSSGRNQTYYYYLCTRADSGAGDCQMKRVSAQALENLIAERIINISRDADFVKRILVEANKTSESELAIIKERMELQKRALAPIGQEIKNIVRFVAQGRGSDALALELERLETQKRQIEDELEMINLEAKEIENRTLNAKAIQEGLGLFSEIWEEATSEEKKELMRFYIYKIIFTPTEIKMGMHTRPVFTENIESTVTSNHEGTGAVNRLNWLPSPNAFHNSKERIENRKNREKKLLNAFENNSKCVYISTP